MALGWDQDSMELGQKCDNGTACSCVAPTQSPLQQVQLQVQSTRVSCFESGPSAGGRNARVGGLRVGVTVSQSHCVPVIACHCASSRFMQ
eukprot:516035-Rhodomonas_salina.1